MARRDWPVTGATSATASLTETRSSTRSSRDARSVPRSAPWRAAARPVPCGGGGERRREPRAGLEQDERGRNAVELGDAGAPRRLLRRQESLEEEPVGRKRGH